MQNSIWIFIFQMIRHLLCCWQTSTCEWISISSSYCDNSIACFPWVYTFLFMWARQHYLLAGQCKFCNGKVGLWVVKLNKEKHASLMLSLNIMTWTCWFIDWMKKALKVCSRRFFKFKIWWIHTGKTTRISKVYFFYYFFFRQRRLR